MDLSIRACQPIMHHSIHKTQMFCGTVLTNLGILTHFETVTLVACILFVHSADYLYVAVWYYEKHQTTYFIHLRVLIRLYRLASYMICLLSQAVKISADNIRARNTATQTRNYNSNMGNMAAGAASHPCRKYICGVRWSRKTPENNRRHE